jgi:hypothetical protein
LRDPSWEPIADIQQLLGCEVEVWPEGIHTVRAVVRKFGSGV